MLNSKEALEHICKNCDNECCPYIHYEQSRCSFYGVIRKDLDQLEKLEKENERLKKDLEVLDIFKDLFNYELVQDFIEHTTIEEWFKIKEWFNK